MVAVSANQHGQSARRPRILVIGDTGENARYHPLDALEEALGILEDEAELIISTDYKQYANRDVPFANIDLIINYLDNWTALDAWEQSRISARLLIWLAGGGALLTVHNGIITHESAELLQMHGGDFTRHDPRTTLRFEIDAQADPLLAQGFSDYEEMDEPYEYTFSAFFDEAFTVWLRYRYQDKLHPAAWYRDYGEGRMLYLMPGHDKQACANPNFKILLKNACHFLLAHQDAQKP